MTEAHEKWTWQKARAASQALALAHDGLHALYEELMRAGRARQVVAIRDGLDNALFHLRQLMVVYAKLPVDGPTAGEAAAVLAEWSTTRRHTAWSLRSRRCCATRSRGPTCRDRGAGPGAVRPRG
jgi:hypothetical protein